MCNKVNDSRLQLNLVGKYIIKKKKTKRGKKLEIKD